MELDLATRRRVTATMVRKYAKATRAEKSAMLGQLCEVNGWHRDHARKALRQAAACPDPAALQRRQRSPVLRYQPEVIEALVKMWAVLDIPMRTWADWDNNVPGFLEVDLVGHDGGDLNGQFCFTLTATDIATGWTENRTVRNKAAKWVFAALVELQGQFPFPVLGIDSDNGSEFINHHLLQWCQDNQITFTRSRPNNSNDGAHVEQKNWAVARRTAGY